MVLKLHLSLCFIIIILVGLLPGFLLAQSGEARHNDDICKQAEKYYLNEPDNKPIHRYYESTEIQRGETVDGHIIIEKGNLAVRGTVNGDILALWGDVKVYHSGVVKGDITSIDGKIDLYDDGQVEGNMLETNWRNMLGKNQEFTAYFYDQYPPHYGTLYLPRTDNNLVMHYNRVEGLFLGLELPKQFRHRSGHLTGYGFAGYGFESEAFRYQVGIDRWFFNPLEHRTELGVEFHDLTDTQDAWRIGFTENSLAAFFLKKDYHDYFRRKGFSVHLTQNISPYFQAGLKYRSDDYETLLPQTNWALFRSSQSFRPNPVLGEDAGYMRSILGNIKIDTRDDIDYTTEGWYFEVSGEHASPTLGGDFDFTRYLVDLRHYRPVTSGESVMLRVIAGLSEGDLPLQKTFELGGISTLRGFHFKEFSGNQMVLANLEYKVRSGLFGNFLWLEHFDLILFTDIGDAWGADAPGIEEFQTLSWRQLKSDVGIAIADRDGDFRINIAKRTDRSANDVAVTFRIRQPF